MDKPLTGKVALVTGGSRGLGAATVRLLAARGAEVAFTYVNSKDKAQAVAEQVRAAGGTAVPFWADHAETGSAPVLIDEVAAGFGGLDILVNNVAIGVQGRRIDDPDIDVGELDRMHATNYTGVIALIRAAAKVLRDDGRIVNVGSGVATRAGMPGLTDYVATKAGLVGYSRGAARDLAHRGITVNVVQA